MGIKSISLAGTILVFSTSVNADTISYNGYALNTDTNIVAGGGIEWLQWDETVGISINDALATYGSDGWRLASTHEMTALFNAFDFGLAFVADENTPQYTTLYDAEYSFSVANQFIDIFGDTDSASGYVTNYGDPLERSWAHFGSDADADGKYQFAVIRDEYTNYGGSTWSRGMVELSYDNAGNTLYESELKAGVALVRGGELTPVPVPAAVWLFGSGLLGLVGIARRKSA